MIFPDSDNVFTLQMLSTNTIVISLTPKIWKKTNKKHKTKMILLSVQNNV